MRHKTLHPKSKLSAIEYLWLQAKNEQIERNSDKLDGIECRQNRQMWWILFLLVANFASLVLHCL